MTRPPGGLVLHSISHGDVFLSDLEGQVRIALGREPYRSARRVFFVADAGSSHRGRRAAARLHAKRPNIILVHTPIHASWRNRIEVCFSVVQRQLPTPGDCADPAARKHGLAAFQSRYRRSAKSFKWAFTRSDLHVLLVKLQSQRRATSEDTIPEYVTVLANRGTSAAEGPCNVWPTRFARPSLHARPPRQGEISPPRQAVPRPETNPAGRRFRSSKVRNASREAFVDSERSPPCQPSTPPAWCPLYRPATEIPCPRPPPPAP